MAFIITASYLDNGNVTDTSNGASLGDWYLYEFATEAAADDIVRQLDEEKDGLGLAGVTYTVEDLGITEKDVAAKDADEWWSIVVGDQSADDFMDGADSAREEALEYLTGSPVVGDIHNGAAHSDLADKLVAVIVDATMKRIEGTYADASGVWDSADWTHEARVNFDGEGDEGDDINYCTGEVDGCTICEEAKADAAKAEAHGARAIALARSGDFGEALDEASSAASLEGEYGDTSVWGPFSDAIAAAAA